MKINSLMGILSAFFGGLVLFGWLFINTQSNVSPSHSTLPQPIYSPAPSTINTQPTRIYNRQPTKVAPTPAPPPSALGGYNDKGCPKDQYVNGYYRKNGTYVEGYYRNSPTDGC
jgi:hypothetical protein